MRTELLWILLLIPFSVSYHEISVPAHEEVRDACKESELAYHPTTWQEKSISSHGTETPEPLVKLRRGFKPDAELTPVPPDEDGFIRIEMKELERIEVHLPSVEPSGTYEGYHVVGNDKRRLPIGSSLDGKAGIFYWILPPGFLGEYQLVFRKKTEALTGKDTRILVKVVPQFSEKPKLSHPN